MTNEICSAPWHGRRFKLKGNMLSWGRFKVEDPQYLYQKNSDRKTAELRFKSVAPELIADAFERLLTLYRPEALPDFCDEIRALAQYAHIMGSLLTIRASIDRAKYLDSIYELQRSYEAVLLTVFRSAKPLQEENVEFVAYRPTLSNPNSALFAASSGFYEAIFDKELVLKLVTKQARIECVWPQKQVEPATSAIIDRLAERHR